MQFDLIIIGGGPAGVAAGVYAARKKIKALLITEGFGGQSLISTEIQNWIGTKALSGYDLGKNLEDHLRAQEIEIIDNDRVQTITKENDGFTLKTIKDNTLTTKTVLVAAGSRRRKLDIPGEKEFDGKGVAYCSTCDAPIFKNKVVAVIGGGNAGLEATVDLLSYCSKVYLLNRSDVLRGDPITQEKLKNNPKVVIITNAVPQKINGDKFVNSLDYLDTTDNQTKTIDVQGIFVEIGSVPNSEMVKDIVSLNKYGEIVVDHKTQQSSIPGIWAAGDISDVLYKQNNISAGDAVKAVLNINEYLSKSH